MRGLNTLIKLHKRQMDLLRRKLSDLERQRDRMLEALALIEQELKMEIELASKLPEMGNFFGDFAARIKQRQQKIHFEMELLDGTINEVRDEIALGFSELKKFELAKEAMLKRKKEEEARKEQIMMDELGSAQFMRHQTHGDR